MLIGQDSVARAALSRPEIRAIRYGNSASTDGKVTALRILLDYTK